eukprot:364197-Chlamydomonas_euryale.AAC.4
MLLTALPPLLCADPVVGAKVSPFACDGTTHCVGECVAGLQVVRSGRLTLQLQHACTHDIFMSMLLACFTGAASTAKASQLFWMVDILYGGVIVPPWLPHTEERRHKRHPAKIMGLSCRTAFGCRVTARMCDASLSAATRGNAPRAAQPVRNKGAAHPCLTSSTAMPHKQHSHVFTSSTAIIPHKQHSHHTSQAA